MPALNSAVNKQAQTDSCSSRKVVPLVQIHSFAQLLENMHRIEVISWRLNLYVLGLPLLLYCLPFYIFAHVFFASASAPTHMTCKQKRILLRKEYRSWMKSWAADVKSINKTHNKYYNIRIHNNDQYLWYFIVTWYFTKIMKNWSSKIKHAIFYFHVRMPSALNCDVSS